MTAHQTRRMKVLSYFLAANWTRWIVVLLLIIGAFYVGRLGHRTEVSAKATRTSEPASSTAKATIWTCSMHPQIKLPEPGACPICGMDLIELEDSSDDAGPRALSMSASDVALAQIQTTAVERRFVESEIRMVGKVDYDETRVKSVSAWIPGRLDRLFVDYTGTAVSGGDHMVLLYSPQLLEAQGSLIEAKKSLVETANEKSEFLRDSALRHLESEREKLRLWGLSKEQIARIEEAGEVEPHIQINAPLSGIVIHKKAVEGMYVQTGSPIYTVADLSVVWIELDLYEMDFSWVRYGQTVEIRTEAYPGEKFSGWISFVPPYLDENTRTKKIRVNVENKDRRLKPGMFVRAVVRSKIASGGRVMDPELAGKHICPMHHEVIKDEPGSCDVCGMELVPATSLGFVTAKDPKEAPIVVPVSAVLLTGRRGVVYVQVQGKARPTFEGREVTVGPRAGDWYVILDGLAEGEIVVTNGNFKIDSALQILAKPSMMSLPAEEKEDDKESNGAALEGFRADLEPVYQAYFVLHRALAADDAPAAKSALKSLGAAAAAVSAVPAGAAPWAEIRRVLVEAGGHADHTEDLQAMRKLFLGVASSVVDLENGFGHRGATIHRSAFCPMANEGKGAVWLQLSEAVENPFYGAAMFRCGDIRTAHEGDGK